MCILKENIREVLVFNRCFNLNKVNSHCSGYICSNKTPKQNYNNGNEKLILMSFNVSFIVILLFIPPSQTSLSIMVKDIKCIRKGAQKVMPPTYFCEHYSSNKKNHTIGYKESLQLQSNHISHRQQHWLCIF